MSYPEAVEAARDRQVISAYAKKESGGEPEGEEGLEEGATARKGGKRQETLVEYMMKKMIDNMLEGSKGNPETTRTPKDRENKAGELLGEVQSRDRSRGLRKEAFGV